MFPTLGLLQSTLCPDLPNCSRTPCVFSHNRRSHLPKGGIEEHGLSTPVTKSTTPLDARSPDEERPSKVTKTHAMDASVSSRNQETTAIMTQSNSGTRKPSSSQEIQPNLVSPSSKLSFQETSTSTYYSSSVPSSSKATPTTKSKAFTSGAPPRLHANPAHSHTDIKTRQNVVNLYHSAYCRIYQQLGENGKSLASKHALEQETSVYDNTGKVGYRSASAHALKRLKNRNPVNTEEEAGTNEQIESKNAAEIQKRQSKMTQQKTSKYVMKSSQELEKYGYVVTVPQGKGGDRPTEEGVSMNCDRCKALYTVKAELFPADRVACQYHSGKLVSESGPKGKGPRKRLYTCCNLPAGASPCDKGPHVFQDKMPEKLHSRVGFVESESLQDSSKENNNFVSIAALDCELVYTTGGLSLARVTLIDEQESPLIDELVRPHAPIIDHLTAFSGIKPGEIEEKGHTLVDIYTIRKIFGMFVGPDTILIGHGLENDLNAIRVVHKNVIDTAAVYPHRLGLPYRNSLRVLVQDHLDQFIQDQSVEHGHDSKIDAIMALNLVRHKMTLDNRSGL